MSYVATPYLSFKGHFCLNVMSVYHQCPVLVCYIFYKQIGSVMTLGCSQHVTNNLPTFDTTSVMLEATQL